MFNKKDPLLDSVKSVMKENEVRRDAERKLCEELGIASKKALPFEHHANYDALLEQRIEEALKGDQHKIDANQNGKVDGQDFKILRGQKKVDEEQLDELSKKTLGSYIKGATQDIRDKSYESGVDRQKGRGGSSLYHGDFTRNAINLQNKAGKRQQGIKTALNKLTTEEDDKEQLDELSKKTLSSYVKGATQDIRDKSYESGVEVEKARQGPLLFQTSRVKNALGLQNKAGKRQQGIKTAVKKLTTEEDDKEMPGDGVQGSGAVTKDGKDVVSSTAPKAEGPSDKERAALTNKVKEVMKEEENLEEKAPSGAKFERMVKHIKAKYAKDGLTKQEKSIAYATAWKAKNKEEMKETVIAELKAKLGEENFNSIMEAGLEDVQKQQMKDPRVQAIVAADTPNKPNIDIKAAQGTASMVGDGGDSKPVPKNVDVDIKAAQGTYSQLTGDQKPSSGMSPQPAKSATPAAPKTADVKTALGDTGPKSVTSMPAPKPAAPAPIAKPAAPRPAAPKAAAPTPTAKPAAPVNTTDDDTSPLAATRQYQASKEAGAFDNKPTAPARSVARTAAQAAKPATSRLNSDSEAMRQQAMNRLAATGKTQTWSNPKQNASGSISLRESLEDTIKKVLKD